MVDESLIAYLKTKLEDEDDKLEKNIRELCSYSDKQPFENEQVIIKLINALDNLKAFDPAVGSGAFPMGMLQKMVYILSKLDQDNKHWQELQIDKAKKESNDVFETKNKEEREKLLIEINNSFDETINNPDYARKLYIIENSIYGVDIQSIAIQISKLRFFISLVIEQKTDKSKDNFGIRPLPNLETKFISANTLIGIEKDTNNLFDDEEIKTLEYKLKKIRHRLFNAKTPRTKRSLREKDKELRENIAEKLEQNGLGNKSAKLLAHWDPYNQNESSPFYDSEWMFGISSGFHIVLGNPPWGAKLTTLEKQTLKQNMPQIDSSTPNSFAYFVGKSMLESNGIMCLILPDSILIKDYAKTREFIKESLNEISWYQNTGIPDEVKSFVFVEHDVCIILCDKKHSLDNCSIRKKIYDSKLKKTDLIVYKLEKNKFIFKKHAYAFNLLITQKLYKLYTMLNTLNTLDDITQCHEGIHTGNVREKLFIKNKSTSSKPLYYGAKVGDIINNYYSKSSGWYVDYRKTIVDKTKGEYASLRDERIFNLPKIYITRTGNPLKAFYDESTYASNNFFSLQLKDYSLNTEESLKSILPLILSRFANFFIRTYASPRLGNTFIETKIIHLLKIPIPKTLKENSKIIKLFTDIIIILLQEKINDESLKISLFELIINSLIINLYFENHMREKEINILEYVENDIREAIQGKEFEDLNSTEKKQIIQKLYDKWTHPDNEVRNRIKLFAVRSPDILKPILES
jgi:hypothetical protein